MLLLAFVAVVLAEDTMPECPQPGDISFSRRGQGFSTLQIFCVNIQSADQIYEPIKQLKGTEAINILYFNDLTVSEPIESDAFMGTSVKEIFVYNSKINFLAPQFTGLEDSLEGISLARCFDSANSLGTLDLGHFSKLEKLFITDNEINDLPDGWLASAPDSLDAIYLYRNGLESLGEHAFSDITSLYLVALNENKLTSMKRSMFPIPALKLRTIDINDNGLDHLPSDMFTEMPDLNWVNIKNNHLTTLDMPTWSDILPQLVDLYITGNPLQCDSSIEWLPSSPAWDEFTGVHGTCESPEKMKGKSLDQLKAEDFD